MDIQSSMSSRSFSCSIDALQGQVKSSYLRAKSNCPHLFETECPAAKFMEVCASDADKAARRMADYWTLRESLFGENAFLPMTSSGKGALRKNDLEVLQSGLFVQLPRNGEEQLVFFYDRTRVDDDFDDAASLVPNILRCAFYIITAACQQRNSKSAVFLLFCSANFKPHKIDQTLTHGLGQILSSCPIRVDSVELLFKCPRIDREEYEEKIIPAVTKLSKAMEDTVSRVNVTVAGSKVHLIQLLRAKNFEEIGIPATAGGSWGYYRGFSAWRRQREMPERIADVRGNEKTLKATTLQIVDEENAKQRKRELDAVYARRARRKHTIEKQALESQIRALYVEQSELASVNAKLQRLLGEAVSAVSTARLAELDSTALLGTRLPVQPRSSFIQDRVLYEAGLLPSTSMAQMFTTFPNTLVRNVSAGDSSRPYVFGRCPDVSFEALQRAVAWNPCPTSNSLVDIASRAFRLEARRYSLLPATNLAMIQKASAITPIPAGIRGHASALDHQIPGNSQTVAFFSPILREAAALHPALLANQSASAAQLSERDHRDAQSKKPHPSYPPNV